MRQDPTIQPVSRPEQSVLFLPFLSPGGVEGADKGANQEYVVAWTGSEADTGGLP